MFALLLYRAFNPVVALLAGAAARRRGDLLRHPGRATRARRAAFWVVYGVTTVVSGAVIGLVCAPLVKAIAATGVLDRFASGRAARRAV